MSQNRSPGRPKKSTPSNGLFLSRNFAQPMCNKTQTPRLPTKLEYENQENQNIKPQSNWDQFRSRSLGPVKSTQVLNQTWKKTDSFYGSGSSPSRNTYSGTWVGKSLGPPLSTDLTPSFIRPRPGLTSRALSMATASHKNLSISNFRNKVNGDNNENTHPNVNTPTSAASSSMLLNNDENFRSIDLTTTSTTSIPVKIKRVEPHMIGFQNLGNTCYLAATVQALVGLPNIISDACELKKQIDDLANVASRKSASDHESHPIVSPFVDLCQALKFGKDVRANKRLKELKDDVAKADETFKGNQMQDASEFLGKLLDEMNVLLDKENLPNLVTSNFDYEREEIIKCCQCNTSESTKHRDLNVFLNLMSSVSQESEKLSLQGMIEKSLADDNRERKCVNCGGEEALISSRLLRLPKVLWICLKRYNWGDELGGDKVVKKVDIPSVISLEKVSVSNCEIPELGVFKEQVTFSEFLSPPSPASISSTPLKKHISEVHLKTPVKFQGKSDEDVQLMSEEDQFEFMMLRSQKENNASRLSEDEQLRMALEASARATPDSGFVSRTGTENSRKRIFSNESPSRPDIKRSRRDLFEAVQKFEETHSEPPQASNKQQESDLLKESCFESTPEVETLASSDVTRDSDDDLVDAIDEEGRLKQALEDSLIDINVNQDVIDEEGRLRQALEDSLLDINVSQDLESPLKNNNGPPNPDFPQGSPDFLYKLHSVVSHHGAGTSSGHYVADVVRYDKGGEWFRYDDTYVKPVREEVVRRERNRENGYIFMYLHKALCDKFSSPAC